MLLIKLLEIDLNFPFDAHLSNNVPNGKLGKVGVLSQSPVRITLHKW